MHVMPACFNVGDTIYFPFDTYDSNGASVTITGLAVTDIEVYKDGSVTQRSSDNGYALLDSDGIDFDGTTGLHGFSIDTSDNSDAGFWSDGSQYWVNVNAITVDGQTVRFTYFLPLGLSIRPTTAGRTLDVTSTGEAGVDLDNVAGTLTNGNVGWVNGSNQVAGIAGTKNTLDDLNDLTAAQVNAEVDNALDTAIPGSPTADSINERIAAIDDLTQSGGSGDLAAVLTDTNSLNDTKVPQTLNLTASGNIGIDWANVENPTSIVDLSATDIQLVDTATDVTNSVTVGTNNDKTGYSLSSSGMDSVTLPANIIDANAVATDAVNEIADGVWDEVITGAQHNVQNSAAKFLRESSEAAAMVRGTAQGATANTLQLESGDVTNDDILNFERVSILEGTGTGQERIITDSDAGTDTITVDRNWTVNPDSSSVYAIGGASSDVRAISGSATAAGNALAFFDNSGFNASASTIGTATNVTTINDKTGYGLSSSERDAIANALLDLADGVEPASAGTERTVREALRIILSATAGKLSGAATTSVSIRDTNDTKDRITATVDADGNRSSVTLDDT